MGLATSPIMTSIKDKVQSNRRRNRIHREDDAIDVKAIAANNSLRRFFFKSIPP